jgi:hypothetical protein
MVETSLQVIDAFIDGERVDPTALKAALAEPAGRDYFVDLWLMREAVNTEAAVEAPPTAAAAAIPRRQLPRWIPAAAAAVAGALIGGYAVGYRSGGVTPAPAPVVSPVTTASAPPPSAFPVPPPTRVIQLEFRTTTTAGGN